MYLTIRHLPKSENRNMNGTYDINEQIKIARKVISENGYIRVADFTLDTNIVEIALEKAFEVTNSIDEPWYFNDGIDVAEIAENGCRSTSVGDIIQCKGISYLVLASGFKEL